MCNLLNFTNLWASTACYRDSFFNLLYCNKTGKGAPHYTEYKIPNDVFCNILNYFCSVCNTWLMVYDIREKRPCMAFNKEEVTAGQNG
jgi:hypothetical protein